MARQDLAILGGLLVSGPLYLGFGYVLAKFGYQRKTLGRAAHARARVEQHGDAGDEARRAAPAGADPSHVGGAEPPAGEVAQAPSDHLRDRHRCRHDRDPQPAVSVDGRPSVASYREFTQHFPRPGWVEHDADEIWEAARATLHEVVDQVGAG